jgi:hypothetical protein
MEIAADAWLVVWNRSRPVNKIRAVDLRYDPKYGGFFEHLPASARVSLDRQASDRVRVGIDDFISPSILERLKSHEGVLTPLVKDWRSMVDSVMIDSAYDGHVFNVAVADVPEQKDLVRGVYEVTLPAASPCVGVKITDMLGEEVLVSLPLEA